MARLPSLIALRCFEAVARLGSVRAAAKALKVTPGAVSQQVKALEAELGVALVRRDGQGLALTEAARAGEAGLTTGFRLLGEAADRMRASKTRRRIRLSVDPSLAATWLIGRLDRFRARAAAAGIVADIVIVASNALADFEEDEIDAAIRFGTGDFPGLVARPLFDDQVCPVASPRLLAGDHPLRVPADLAHHVLLHLEWNTRAGRWPDWSSWLEAARVEGIDAGAGPRFTDHALALQAAVDGQGVALGSTGLVRDHLAAGRLVEPFSLCLTTPFAYYFVYPEQAAARPSIRALEEWLVEEATRS